MFAAVTSAVAVSLPPASLPTLVISGTVQPSAGSRSAVLNRYLPPPRSSIAPILTASRYLGRRVTLARSCTVTSTPVALVGPLLSMRHWKFRSLPDRTSAGNAYPSWRLSSASVAGAGAGTVGEAPPPDSRSAGTPKSTRFST